MRGTIAVIVACLGCHEVKTSTLPPYVRVLKAAPGGGIEMVHCKVTYQKETSWSPFIGSKEKKEITEGPCWKSIIPTATSRVAP